MKTLDDARAFAKAMVDIGNEKWPLRQGCFKPIWIDLLVMQLAMPWKFERL